MQYRNQNVAHFENLESPVFKRVKLPEIVFPNVLEFDAVKLIADEGVHIESIDNIQDSHTDVLKSIDQEFERSLGDKFITFANGFYNTGNYIKVSNKSNDYQIVKFKFDTAQPVVENNFIEVESGSKIMLVFEYESEEMAIHHGLTRILARPHSDVMVIKLQRLNEESSFFDQTIALVEDQAKITLYDVQLGAKYKAVNYQTNLKGYRSESVMKTVYYGEKDDRLDLSYTAAHFGEYSNSTILTKGALKDNAKKVFRGNLNFKYGSRQSVGKEEEFVVLLDKTVKSDSIPTLMCSEDDVIGEHAASAGKIDENKLFYLMSRGLSEKVAKKLIVSSSYAEVLSSLPDKALAEMIIEDVERRIEDAI